MTRQRFRTFFTTGVFAATLLTSSTAMAQTDMFLRIDNVTGESLADGRKGEIDVMAWSWGQSTAGAQTSRGTAPTVCIQDLSVTKHIDSASPGLIMNSLIGEVAPNAVLELRRAGDRSPGVYLRLAMRNVTVSSYQTGGAGGESRLTEHVTLHFESMLGSYQKQNPDGTPMGAPITFNVSAGASSCR